MHDRVRVALIFGGRSVEHEISILSAKNISNALVPEKYDLVRIAVDRQGRWMLADDISIPAAGRASEVMLVPGGDGRLEVIDGSGGAPAPVDVVFPALHGPLGEDGTVQGLLRLANVAFVGSDTLGSAVSMDKEVSKRLLRDEGIRTARFISVRPDQNIRFDDVVSELGSTLFVKPASLGSSVGVNKVKNAEDFDTAINHAFRYDHKVLVEEFIAGREIECAVLESGGRPIATVPGEIAPASSYEYYSYEAKYTDASGAKLVIPADLPPPVAAEVQDIALRTFTALCAEGLARVDFFLTRDGQILVNEMNTMPGFTAISMYPKLWAASGLEYGALMDKLIAHAQARFAREQRLQTQLAERTERKSPGSA